MIIFAHSEGDFLIIETGGIRRTELRITAEEVKSWARLYGTELIVIACEASGQFDTGTRGVLLADEAARRLVQASSSKTAMEFLSGIGMPGQEIVVSLEWSEWAGRSSKRRASVPLESTPPGIDVLVINPREGSPFAVLSGSVAQLAGSLPVSSSTPDGQDTGPAVDPTQVIGKPWWHAVVLPLGLVGGAWILTSRLSKPRRTDG